MKARGGYSFFEEVIVNDLGSFCGEFIAVFVWWQAVGVAADFNGDLGVFGQKGIDFVEYGVGGFGNDSAVIFEIEFIQSDGLAFFEISAFKIGDGYLA